MITRDDVVNQARTWIGTRFYHQGRSKKQGANPGGCDCIGLVIGVCRELEILPDINDEKNYSRLPSGRRLQEELDKHLIPIQRAKIEPADIVLFRMVRNPQHIGIISQGAHGLNVIHALSSPARVVEHSLSGFWEKSIIAAYRLREFA